MRKKVIMSWSSGKDSALALYKILQHKDYQVEYLMTTVTEGYDRISMHGVRIELLELQAEKIGIPLMKVVIPQQCSNEIYQEIMKKQLIEIQEMGINTFVFGDIYLEDVRSYREEQLKPMNFKAIFPRWGEKTSKLAKEFIDLNFKTIITCVDTLKLSGGFSGEEYTKDFIKSLPQEIDPCGENGEFHSFCFDGPIYSDSISINIGEKTLRDDRFMYTDILKN